MEIISYGGGIQTVALSILNAGGRVEPRATHAVFADTGAETPGTYEHVEIMKRWLARHGIEFVTVRNERDGDLESYVRERSTAIPVRLTNGIGHRQCTVRWKIEPVESWVGAGGVQQGISLDEFHRAKPSRNKHITARFPLIDLRLTRNDCRTIIEDAGLPVPPKSSCYFCPFHRISTWQNLATFEPELFEQAAQLEDIINERKDTKGQERAYLSSKMKPLRQAFSTNQLPLPLDVAEPDDMCGGYCFV